MGLRRHCGRLRCGIGEEGLRVRLRSYLPPEQCEKGVWARHCGRRCVVWKSRGSKFESRAWDDVGLARASVDAEWFLSSVSYLSRALGNSTILSRTQRIIIFDMAEVQALIPETVHTRSHESKEKDVLIEQLDGLLERYLRTLDEYDRARRQLASQLSSVRPSNISPFICSSSLQFQPCSMWNISDCDCRVTCLLPKPTSTTRLPQCALGRIAMMRECRRFEQCK